LAFFLLFGDNPAFGWKAETKSIEILRGVTSDNLL